MDAERLSKLPLFEELDRHDLSIVARWADDIDVQPGTALLEEGRFPHEFFVIEEGTAEVVAGDKHLADLGPGDFFGEMALLEQHRRNATVRATSAMRVVVMHARDFSAMEDEMPEIAQRIREVMEERRLEHQSKVDETSA